jgi:hypothetical protein
MDWGDGWSHVVLITGVVKDENGNVVDDLIDSIVGSKELSVIRVWVRENERNSDCGME